MSSLTLDVEPAWSRIDELRQRCAEFLRAQGIDRETTDAIAMVACELAENAAKYGHFSSARRTLHLAITVAPREIVVEVRNPVGDGADAHLERLDRTIQWIRGYQDPYEVYLERLREVAGQRLDSKESGLGLVRIAYEGQATLDFYVDEHDTLAVSAMVRRAS